jgi:SAM-dependent methyltransferase
MTEFNEQLRDRFFGDDEHPYQTLVKEVDRYLRPDHTLLDAGCGRTAPVLRKYVGKARRLIGIDLVDFENSAKGLELYQADLGRIPLRDGEVDLVMSRSVMEHVTDPLTVYREIARVMKPGGHFIFLTGNLWDYAGIGAKLIPNRFHPWIVRRISGRAEKDVFPVAYKTNTLRAVRKWASLSGFEITSFRYLGQYPDSFMFSRFLFIIATGYEKLLQRFTPLHFLRGWIFVTLRKK